MIVRCQHCGLDLKAPADSEGKILACPGCGGRFVCRLPEAIVLGMGRVGSSTEPGQLPEVPHAEPATPSVGATDPTAQRGSPIATQGGWEPPPGQPHSSPGFDVPLAPAAPADAQSLDQLARAADAARQDSPPAQGLLDSPPVSLLEQLAMSSSAAGGAGNPLPPAEGSRPQAAALGIPPEYPWYVLLGGVPTVAMTFQQLHRKAAEGILRPRDKLYYAPKALRMRAADVPGLFPALQRMKSRRGGLLRPFRKGSPADPAAMLNIFPAPQANRPTPHAGPAPGSPAPHETASNQSSATAGALATIQTPPSDPACVSPATATSPAPIDELASLLNQMRQ